MIPKLILNPISTRGEGVSAHTHEIFCKILTFIKEENDDMMTKYVFRGDVNKFITTVYFFMNF